MFCKAILSSLIFKLFWLMQSRFPHDVAQMHHVQIRDLRVPHSSPLCLFTLLIDV